MAPSPLISTPRVLDPHGNYTFRSYFELNSNPSDILGDFGCKLVRQKLELPQADWEVEPLKQYLEGYLPYVILDSEDIRKQALIGPVMLALAKEMQSPLKAEYSIIADRQYLKGNLDYYLETGQGLLVVEAKHTDLTRGFVQLAVELIALHLWRQRSEQPVTDTLTGCVTTGEIWQFGQYSASQKQITQDLSLYRVPDDLELLSRCLKGVVAPP